MWNDATTSVPTLAELRQHSALFWLCYERCLYRAPVAFVPWPVRCSANL